MKMPNRQISAHGLLVVTLLITGCASGGVTKPAQAPAASLARALPSVESSKQPASRPPNREEGTRYFRLALQQLQQHNDQQALRLFEQSAEADPTQPATHNNLGILYKRVGQLEKAIDAYQQAITHQATYPEAHYNLALAYRAQGDFKKAEEAYLQALTLNDQFADAHYNLGILYDLYLGQPTKALEQYRAYLRLSGPYAQEVARWVASLERVVPQESPASTEPSPAAQSTVTPSHGAAEALATLPSPEAIHQ